MVLQKGWLMELHWDWQKVWQKVHHWDWQKEYQRGLQMEQDSWLGSQMVHYLGRNWHLGSHLGMLLVLLLVLLKGLQKERHLG